MEFRFDDAKAAINWPRVVATNVTHLQRTNNHQGVLDFLADVAVGDVDDGYVDYGAKAHLTSLRLLQLSVQYLVYSQQALRHKTRTLDTGLRRLAKREAKEKKRCLERRATLKMLRDEAERQDDVLSTYHTMLEALDPDTAASLAQGKDGRLVFAPTDEPSVVAPPSTRSVFSSSSSSSSSDDDDDDDAPPSPPRHPMRRLATTAPPRSAPSYGGDAL